ncbi:MAG: permease [Dehalococcoidia bacterium]|nr:permease [Dehalococcoidia bacterium]
MKSTRPLFGISLAAFLFFLALALVTLVDIRRGFLFPAYLKVGAPSAILNLNTGHLPLLLAAGLGLWLTFKYLAKQEKDMEKKGVDLKKQTGLAAVFTGTFLIIDLFIYRGVPATRALVAGKMGVSHSIPSDLFPGWLQPAVGGVDYLLLVWHATALSILIGSLFLVAGAGVINRLKGSGFGAHLTGAATALTQPFCSCCASPIASVLYRKGAALGPALAFMVSAPMLNVTTLVLSAALLPTRFAVLRIGGGIIIGVFITYAVARIAKKWVEVPGTGEVSGGKPFLWSSKILSAYNRLFHFENLLFAKPVETPVSLISNWLRTTWRLTVVVVPVLLAGSVLAMYIVRVMPSSNDNLASVAVTAFFSTLLMVPTWTEIPLAAGFINNGLTGTAATVLIALPAVSLPCLVIIAGAVRSWRTAALLGILVVATAIAAGILFL